MDLFASETGLQPIAIEDGELSYAPQLALSLTNAQVMARLLAESPYRQESIQLWGERHLQPRLTAWHGAARYRYSGLLLEPLPFTELQLEILQAVQSATGRRFNSLLLNYYRDGRDSMGMHSDDEAELGEQPAIASLSFGATRSFMLKHKQSRRSVKFDLHDGSLLLMAGSLQKHWLHGINKTAKPVGARLNLTFRFISSSYNS